MNSPITLTNRHPNLRPAHRPQQRLVQKVFASERKRGSVDIILAGSSLLRTLNRRHRKQNKTTDVLSFPFGAEGRPDASGFWGEIYINLDLVLREAKHNKTALKDALALRIVHGLLHLFGYDHKADNSADTMAHRENRYLKAAGFAPTAQITKETAQHRRSSTGKRQIRC